MADKSITDAEAQLASQLASDVANAEASTSTSTSAKGSDSTKHREPFSKLDLSPIYSNLSCKNNLNKLKWCF